MLTNAQPSTPDQRTGDSSDPTEHPTPLHRRPYWNQTIAAFSDSLWLPDGTTHRGSLINTAHGWTSNTAAHSWFSTNRIAAPNPDLPNLYSTAAVQDTATRATAGATKQQTRRIQGLSRPHPEDGYQHLAHRQPIGPTTSPSRYCSQAFRQFGNTSPAW